MVNLAQLEADLARIDARLNAIAGGDGEPTDEDLTEYADLTAEREETERAVRDVRQRLRQTLNLGQELRTPSPEIEEGVAIAGGMPRSYELLFGKPQASPFKANEYIRCILNGWHDTRLVPMAQMGEGTGSAGGLLVPQVLEQRLLDKALHASIFLSRSAITPMSSSQTLIAGYSATDQSAGLYGMKLEWLAEHAEATPGSALIRGILLNAHTAGIYTGASNELVADSPNFESTLMERMGESAGDQLDSAFLLGTGAGMPLGLLRSSALLVIDQEAGQDAGTLLTENILAMASHSTNLPQSIWIANPSTLPALGVLSFSVGASTAPSVLLTQSADGLLLMGRPIVFHHRMPTLGLQSDLVLADLSQYVIGMRKGIGVEASPHPGFLRRELTLRAILRCDGQPVTHGVYKGADGRSYSPFVCLEAR